MELTVILGVIVLCEVGFWVLLAAGLLARYALHRRRVSAVLLACVPVVDLVLLATTVVDLRGGATATAAHGLAAAYIGFSVAFGHSTIRALDAWVGHRFAGAPAPPKARGADAAELHHQWRLCRRAALGWVVASTLLWAAIIAVDDAERTAQLTSWSWGLTLALALWLVAGPVRVAVVLRRRGRTPRRAGRRPRGAADGRGGSLVRR